MGCNVSFYTWTIQLTEQSITDSVVISAKKTVDPFLLSARPMAAKILSPHPHPLTSLSLLPPSNSKFNKDLSHQKPWPGQARNPMRPKCLAVRVSLQDHVLSSAALLEHHHNPSSLLLLAESMGYSLASYYTSLGLFVISVPGLWSLIKRSVKSKVPILFFFFFSFATNLISS